MVLKTMAFESCPKCSNRKHQLVKCPSCGFQRNPYLGPVVVDVQPQGEAQHRAAGAKRDNPAAAEKTPMYQTRQRRSQHGLRNHDQRREDSVRQPHPNSYEYQSQTSERHRTHHNMQPRHNQFGQPIGGATQSVASDGLKKPRKKQAKAAVITYKLRSKIPRPEREV